jgi:hypothetical protein
MQTRGDESVNREKPADTHRAAVETPDSGSNFERVIPSSFVWAFARLPSGIGEAFFGEWI